MIYHKDCGNILRIDITSQVRVLATFSIVGKFTAQVTELSFHRMNKNKIPIKYFCRKCNRNTTERDILISKCDNCNKKKEISEMRVPSESGGVYCEKCIKRFSDEKIYTISIKDIKLPG